MSIHNVAATGFGQAAKVYEEARPSYPVDVIQYIQSLCPSSPDVIVDLGAGTGKLTRLLGPINARKIIAIEPVAEMRENLQTIPIINEILDGTAENTALPENSVDVVLCAQAFHWFANHRALAEIHHVLKPNGLFVLIWNQPSDSQTAWWHEISNLVDALRAKDTPRYMLMEWKKAFDNQEYFTPLKYQNFLNIQRGNRDMVIKRILSTSFISAASKEEQKKLLEDVRNKLDKAEALQNQEEFDVNNLTDVYWCSAIKIE